VIVAFPSASLKLVNLTLLSGLASAACYQAVWWCAAVETEEERFQACGCCDDDKLDPKSWYCSKSCQRLDWRAAHKEWHRQQKENASCPNAVAGSARCKKEWESRPRTDVDKLIKDVSEVFVSASEEEKEKRVLCTQLQEKGLDLIHAKNYHKAAKTFRRAIVLCPSEPRSYYNLGLVQLRCNK